MRQCWSLGSKDVEIRGRRQMCTVCEEVVTIRKIKKKKIREGRSFVCKIDGW
jgi:hypothetical protein